MVVKTNKSKIGCTGLGEDMKQEVQRSEIKERKTDAGGRTNSCWGKDRVLDEIEERQGEEEGKSRCVRAVQCARQWM